VHSILELDEGLRGDSVRAAVCHCKHLSSEYAVARARAPEDSATEESHINGPYMGMQYKDDFFIIVIFSGIGMFVCLCCAYNMAVQRLHAGKHPTEHAATFDRRATAHAVQLPGVQIKGREVARAIRSRPAADPHALLERREQKRADSATTSGGVKDDGVRGNEVVLQVDAPTGREISDQVRKVAV
jgi:hypothetical protein